MVPQGSCSPWSERGAHRGKTLPDWTPQYLNSLQGRHSHVEEDSIQDRHWDELKMKGQRPEIQCGIIAHSRLYKLPNLQEGSNSQNHCKKCYIRFCCLYIRLRSRSKNRSWQWYKSFCSEMKWLHVSVIWPWLNHSPHIFSPSGSSSSREMGRHIHTYAHTLTHPSLLQNWNLLNLL